MICVKICAERYGLQEDYYYYYDLCETESSCHECAAGADLGPQTTQTAAVSKQIMSL
jgi:hypothetical protein